MQGLKKKKWRKLRNMLERGKKTVSKKESMNGQDGASKRTEPYQTERTEQRCCWGLTHHTKMSQLLNLSWNNNLKKCRPAWTLCKHLLWFNLVFRLAKWESLGWCSGWSRVGWVEDAAYASACRANIARRGNRICWLASRNAVHNERMHTIFARNSGEGSPP